MFLLSSTDESNVSNGMRGVKRMLEGHGFTIADVVLALAHDQSTQIRASASKVHSGYGGMREDPHPPRPRPATGHPAPPRKDCIEQRAAQLLARTEFSSEGLPIISGNIMPPTVEGIPSIVAREDTPFGPIILFCIVSQGACYGPIASISKRITESVTMAERRISRLRVHIVGPYDHCPVAIANRVFPGTPTYA